MIQHQKIITILDAGHMGAGPELSSGQECDGQGLLFSQARSSPVPPVCPAIYQVSAYGSRLVDESVVSSTTVVLRLQRLQLGRMQWYQAGLATGLRQWYSATGRPTGLLWYRVHTGTGLRQWQGHRLDMPRRPGTQATHSKPSTSNSKTENYSVPRPCSSVGRVPRVADSCVVPMPHSVGRVPALANKTIRYQGHVV